MARNVEIKARLADPEATRERVEELTEGVPMMLAQEDIFFHSREGRLKLRKTETGAELIYYERPDEIGPAESHYMKTECSDGAATEAMLSVALGIRGILRKRRAVYRVGQTRVHLDEVDGLGSFLELEVVLASEQAAEEGERVALDLLEKLGVDIRELVAEAYIDLQER